MVLLLTISQVCNIIVLHSLKINNFIKLLYTLQLGIIMVSPAPEALPHIRRRIRNRNEPDVVIYNNVPGK